MWYDGMKFRRVPHLAYRLADARIDTDAEGYPLQRHETVIVKVADCPLREGRRTTAGVKAHVRLIYLSNNAGYGPKRKSERWGYTYPIYLVYDGRVYRSTVRGKGPEDE